MMNETMHGGSGLLGHGDGAWGGIGDQHGDHLESSVLLLLGHRQSPSLIKVICARLIAQVMKPAVGMAMQYGHTQSVTESAPKPVFPARHVPK